MWTFTPLKANKMNKEDREEALYPLMVPTEKITAELKGEHMTTREKMVSHKNRG